MLFRRGQRPSSLFDPRPPEAQRTEESVPKRVAGPIYPGASGGVYPVVGGQKRRGRCELALEVLGDGQYHEVSAVAGACSRPAECVAAIAELLDKGYAFVRHGSCLKLRRRGELERRQSLLELLDGINLGTPSVKEDESPSLEQSSSGNELDGPGDFDPEDDVGLEGAVEGGMVVSEPASALTLPVEGCASRTSAILARKGSGKSYLGMVLVEEMCEVCEGVAIVVFDPTGVWWGLCATSSGEPSSLGVLLLGGPRGHADVRATDGGRVAELVSELRPRLLVVDMSLMAPAEQHQHVADFCERLIGLPHFPTHIVFDEADEFAPQRLGSISAHQKRSLGYVERLVMRGRSRGIGVTLISLRPAVISKNVLSQVDALWLLQMVAPNDLRAIDDWLEHFDHKVSERQRAECLSQLPVLPVGTAYFLMGGERAVFRRFKVRRKRTYDSSKTLVAGANDNPILAPMPRSCVEGVGRLLAGRGGASKSDGESE